MKLSSIMKTNKYSVLALSGILLSFSTQALAYDDFDAFYGMELTDLDQVKQALSTGGVVTASMDLEKCTLANGQPSRNSSGGLKIDSYLIERDGTLRFSSFRTTLSSRSDVAVTQSNAYRVFDNGDMVFTSSVFSMPDYSLISKVEVACKLNESVQFYLAY